MSWLFDRLCDLATADEVEIVVDIDRRRSPAGECGAHDLVSVLLRATEVPQLAVVVTGGPPTGTIADPIAIDLDDVHPDLRRLALIDCLEAQLGATSSELVVRGGSLTVDRAIERPHDAAARARRMVASDGRAGLGRLDGLGPRDLSIAVGGVSPDASISVDDLLGVTSIIDALVTLRQFAFGSCAA